MPIQKTQTQLQRVLPGFQRDLVNEALHEEAVLRERDRTPETDRYALVDAVAFRIAQRLCIGIVDQLARAHRVGHVAQDIAAAVVGHDRLSGDRGPQGCNAPVLRQGRP